MRRFVLSQKRDMFSRGVCSIVKKCLQIDTEWQRTNFND